MSVDSSDGILDNFMGNYEGLQKSTCANKIGTALYFAILQHRKNLETESVDENERYVEYLNLTEELNPKTKPRKTKKKADDEETEGETEADEDDDEEEVDELAYAYTYIGELPVKGDDGKSTGETYEAEMKKKKFISMATPVKQVLQYMLNCLVHESYSYYSENDNSFPADENNILSEVANYALKHCHDAISPFIFEVADLYEDVSNLLEDETKKGTGVLRSWMETEFKKIFKTGKSKKMISTQLIHIQDGFINFIKVLAIFLMDHFWENKTPLNFGKLLGSFRQLSRFVAKNGGECPPMFYQYARLYVDQNTKRTPAKGKGKGTGKAPAKGKGKGAGKGKGTGKTPAKGKGKGAGKKAAEPEEDLIDDEEDFEDEDEDDGNGQTLDSALDAIDDDEDFGEEWADDAIPDDE